VQPQAMDENNRSFRVGHDRLPPRYGSDFTAIVPGRCHLNRRQRGGNRPVSQSLSMRNASRAASVARAALTG